MTFQISLLPSVMAGIGLKSRHAAELLDQLPRLSFLEIHAENYFGDGGPPHRWLAALAEHYPLSVHGIGLSLGSPSLDDDHLDAFARVVERTAPILVSEHLAWAQTGGVWMNDLLPIPYTSATLDMVARNIERTQDRVRRPLLVENPSAAYGWAESSLTEAQFLAELSARTGCGILLDINNLYVSAANTGLDADAYLRALPAQAVGQYHLAGHHVSVLEDGSQIRIDDHGSAVSDAVWQLYAQALRLIGPRPTLIEWDTDIPPLSTLLDQARKAEHLAETIHAVLG